MLVLSNFFFCHYVSKKPSAAEASESVYMRERVKQLSALERKIATHMKQKLRITNSALIAKLMSVKYSSHSTVKQIQCYYLSNITISHIQLYLHAFAAKQLLKYYEEPFLLLPGCFQLYSITLYIFSLPEIYLNFAWMFSRSSAADLLYVGKG